MNQNTRKRNILSLPLGHSAVIARAYMSEVVLGLLLSIIAVSVLLCSVSQLGMAAKKGLGASCNNLQVATNAIASTPYFTAQTINKVTLSSVQLVQKNAVQSITLTITLLKDLLFYILLRYQKVLQCVVFMSASASLHAISHSAAEIASFVDKELGNLSTAISKGLDGLNDQLKNINEATSKISTPPSIGVLGINIGGGGPVIPQIPLPVTLPGISGNLKWSLPNGTADSLKSLSSLAPPKLQDIHSDLKRILSKPFDDLISKLEKDLEETVSKRAFNASTFSGLPLPSKVDSIEFCNGALPLHAVDRLVEGLQCVLWLTLTFLIIALVFVVLSSAFSQSQLHQWKLDRIDMIKNKLFESHETADIDQVVEQVYWALENPVIGRVVALYSRVTKKEPSRAWLKVLWMMVFSTHPVAVLCMTVGLIGYLVLQFQLVLITLVVKGLLPFLIRDVESFGNSAASLVDNAIDKSVGAYITAFNAEMERMDEVINDVMFGWISQTVGVVENGVSHIFHSLTDAMDSLMVLAPLKPVVNDFFTCVVGNITQMMSSLDSKTNHTFFTRLGPDQFQMDAARILDDSPFRFEFQEIAANSSGIKLVYLRELDKLVAAYSWTIWIQSLPFLVMFLFGFSLVLVGFFFLFIDSFARRRASSSR